MLSFGEMVVPGRCGSVLFGPERRDEDAANLEQNDLSVLEASRQRRQRTRRRTKTLLPRDRRPRPPTRRQKQKTETFFFFFGDLLVFARGKKE
jgi:hypothetical protein